MKASEITVEELYRGAVVYVTPSFQRSYTAVDGMCESLLAAMFAERSDAHFMGALVTRELADMRRNFRKALLIDGNQRLLTLLMLMLAVRDKLAEFSSEASGKLNSMCFMNVSMIDGSNVLKNTVSPKDRAVFESIVLCQPSSFGSHPLIDVYELGLDAVAKCSQAELEVIVERLLHSFTFVELALARDENPYPVFKLFNPGENDFTRTGFDAYAQFSRDAELMDLIAGGESQEVEFKAATVRLDRNEDRQSQGVWTIVRAVAAFLNSASGGTLLIGVGDDGHILGIENEYAIVDKGKSNWDGYQLFLQNTLRAKLDSTNAFLYCDVERRSALMHDVCLISIRPASEPVYIEKRLYVRIGAQTIEMLGPDLVAYVHERFMM